MKSHILFTNVYSYGINFKDQCRKILFSACKKICIIYTVFFDIVYRWRCFLSIILDECIDSMYIVAFLFHFFLVILHFSLVYSASVQTLKIGLKMLLLSRKFFFLFSLNFVFYLCIIWYCTFIVSDLLHLFMKVRSLFNF